MGGIGGNLSQIGESLYLIVNGNVVRGEGGRKLRVVMSHYLYLRGFGIFGLAWGYLGVGGLWNK